MSDKCWMCGYAQEALEDNIPLCHWCYVAFGDVNSPFFNPAFVDEEIWALKLSDPSARMWVQERLENY